MYNLEFLFLCGCLWKAAIEWYLKNKVVPRSSHLDAFFNIAVLHLKWNSSKNTSDGVHRLVNLYVMVSNFETLLRKFKWFITALMLKGYFCRTPLASLCSENLGKIFSRIINKPHVGRQQVYWELQWRRSRGNFPEHLKQYTKLFMLANLSITVKSN